MEDIKEAKNRLKILLKDECDCPECLKNKEAYKIILEKLETLQEDVWTYHQLLRMENEREYRSKFLKEFQEEYGKNIMPDYDEIYKRYDKMKKDLKNSIPKKKIENKLKKLLDGYKDKADCAYGLNFESREQQDINKQVKILQELLEENK